MKNLKKLASLALALVMTLALMVPAFADDPVITGTITLNNTKEDVTYNAYKMFDVTVDESGAKRYSVSDDSDWYNFVVTGDGREYVDLYTGTNTAFVAPENLTADTVAYVVLKEQVGEMNTRDQIIADFARKALAYAASEKLDADGAADQNGVIDNLSFGYYVISGADTMCALSLDEPTEEITLKANKPTIEKTSDKATAEVGEDVTFTLTVHALPGAVNYVIHDAMGAGLTLKTDSIAVAGLVKDTDYTVNTNPGCTHEVEGQNTKVCTFTVTIDQDWLNENVTEAVDITVTYTATLNANAVDEDASTVNETALNYGPNDGWTNWEKNNPDPDPEDPDPTPDDPEIKAYYFDLVKTDSKDVLLKGAEFKLYDAATDGNEIKLTQTEDGYYRPAVEGEEVAEAIVVTDGQVAIKGLSAAKTYYLEETVAPENYNKLTDRVEVKLVAEVEVDEANADGTQATEIRGANKAATVENGTWKEGGVQVVNLTGAELPETGGIGTTIFYTMGALLVVGAGILLVAKKRMAM